MTSEEQAGVIIGFVVVGFFTVAAFGFAVFLGRKLAAVEDRLAEVGRRRAVVACKQ